jgi:nuclear pore complex protein Nup133
MGVYQQLMLSIGKLCHLAQVHENEGALDQKTLDGTGPVLGHRLAFLNAELEAFHYDLDFVSVHENIIAEMKLVLKNVRTKQSLDAQADGIAQKKATKLKAMPALFDVCGFLSPLAPPRVLILFSSFSKS